MAYKNKNAFTLIEMLIVVTIIGLLAAALIPRLRSVQGRANYVSILTDLRNIDNAVKIYNMDTNLYPADDGPGGFPPELKPYLTSGPSPVCKNISYDWNNRRDTNPTVALFVSIFQQGYGAINTYGIVSGDTYTDLSSYDFRNLSPKVFDCP